MALTDEVKGLQAASAAHEGALEGLRHQTAALRTDHDTFEEEVGPPLRDVTAFRNKVDGYLGFARLFMALGTPILVALFVMAASGYAANARRDERLNGLDRRMGDFDRRMGDFDRRMGDFDRRMTDIQKATEENTRELKEVRDRLGKVEERLARTEEALKAISASLIRIEANQKKGP